MNEVLAFFERIDPILGAFIATTFTWVVTAAGSSLVFFFGNASRKWLSLNKEPFCARHGFVPTCFLHSTPSNQYL